MDILENSVREMCKKGSIEVMGKPFGAILALLSVAEYVTKVHSICIRCGNLAHSSFRNSEEQQVILVDEKNNYEPLCRNCYSKAFNI